MTTTRSQWSARRDRLDKRTLRRDATAPVSQCAAKSRTTGCMKQAAHSTYRSSSPGPSPSHSSQPTPDDSPTTDIPWLQWEVERLLLLVGDRLDLGTVNEISLHFLNKTRDQIRAGHEVLRKKGLLPIQPPLSALDLKFCMAALKDSLRSKPTPV
ncbi:hypothetical protein B0H14DRAFT_3170007 [Mycena olivaceomarginata]|nr:hypothetical protein B0H14DRAFT_3170007 [Mycena olivaceomarginata]